MKISREDIESARSLSGEMKSEQEQSMFQVKLILDDEANEIHQDYKLLWKCYPKSALSLRKDKFAKRLRTQIEAKPQHKVAWLNTRVKMLLGAAAIVLLGLFFIYNFICKRIL
ncbi:hypothetical protein ACU8V7_27860 [Zobellia nedashkovskayae]